MQDRRSRLSIEACVGHRPRLPTDAYPRELVITNSRSELGICIYPRQLSVLVAKRSLS